MPSGRTFHKLSNLTLIKELIVSETVFILNKPWVNNQQIVNYSYWSNSGREIGAYLVK